MYKIYAFVLLVFLASISFKGGYAEESGSEGGYQVKAYLVYPEDKPMYPEYERAVEGYLRELRQWFAMKVGKVPNFISLQVLRSQYKYLNIRCGETPSVECINDPGKLDGNIGMYMNKTIHDGREAWEENTIALIFSVGSGGYAGGTFLDGNKGFAIVGDWVLEPLSGVRNSWGIPCSYSNGWQCRDSVAKGTPAHELGHALGLPHPGEQYAGQSIMQWHGDYPTVGFLPGEVEYLRGSPFFK